MINVHNAVGYCSVVYVRILQTVLDLFGDFYKYYLL